MRNGFRQFALITAAMLIGLTSVTADAGPLRERLKERMQERRNGEGDGRFGDMDIDGIPSGISGKSCKDFAGKVNNSRRAAKMEMGPAASMADLAYGSQSLEKMDVFLPSAGSNVPSPIIVMVHGGAWCIGDKAVASVTKNKVERWVNKGFVFVTVNYPMLNDGSDAIDQAHHVAEALHYVQIHARDWKADPTKIILMGHSAGGHLVSLVNADTNIRRSHQLLPILGTISLDAAATNVVTQMPKTFSFLKTIYAEAFGTTEDQWINASPYHRLSSDAAPWQGVCSTKRKDDPCGQAKEYAAKSISMGLRADVLPEDKSHGEINAELGAPGAYTNAVEQFMASLDPVVANLLK